MDHPSKLECDSFHLTYIRIVVRTDSHGTYRQSWYVQTVMVRTDSHGTYRQSWYVQTVMVRTDSHGTYRLYFATGLRLVDN